MSLAACLVFLIPGAFGKGTSSLFLAQRDYFADYVSYFRGKGCESRIVEYPEDATIELRAILLRDQVAQAEKLTSKDCAGGACQKTRIYLVGHSQGGLDARFALQTKHLAGVSALAMIGVPNHGTPLANWALKQRRSGSLVYWLLRLFGGYDLRAIPFAAEMTPEFLAEKASFFAPVDGVRYAAGAGVCRTECSWSLRAAAWWIGLGTGDGLVPSESQRFGADLGEFDLDHISEVGADASRRLERRRLLDAMWKFFSHD